MRKRLVVKAFAVLALLAAFLVHWPDAAVARAQTAGTPTGSSATTVRVRGTLTDLSTGKCLDDSLGYGLRTNTCNGLDYQNFILTETVDGFLIYDVIQNVHTGSCVDDSLAYGLRGNYCNGLNYQQFFFNFHP